MHEYIENGQLIYFNNERTEAKSKVLNYRREPPLF